MRDDALFSIAIERDQKDVLGDFASHFDLPPDIVYMDGNSLGALPRATSSRVIHAIREEWGNRLVQGWNEGWVDLPERIGSKIARLIGAHPDEVLVCDSTSVNFYKLLKAASCLQKGKGKALTEEMGFPTNRYILQGAFEDSNLEEVRSEDGIHIWPEEVEKRLDTDLAVMCLNHVNYRSGWLHDMKRLNASARKVGALNLWDLSHSVGVVPIDVRKSDTDLAVGCTYKYLNGGPGAPAFLYVRRELQDKLQSPIQGWFGQQDFFEFGARYEPEQGIRRFHSGTPNILSMVAVETGVDLVLDAGVSRIRDKSIELTNFFIELYEDRLRKNGVRLNSPTKPQHRGSHISLGHERAFQIDQVLIKRMGVIPDFRKPDNIRFGMSPLYNTFEDVYEAADRMRVILEDGSYETFDGSAGQIT